ncbi:hypothetical protein KM539_00225 [Xanthomonas translucens pv. poae]|uniref:hypothetical protein n=1 Tax=Xanthomonas graminis TaxID=3390026 RepID=UPI001BAF166F|nr:hypothetical protein [Xanthomonas translucens]UKE62055.1 hypothetical protein KM539_00225 [Xanthomonas translucens pv. poae]
MPLLNSNVLFSKRTLSQQFFIRALNQKLVLMMRIANDIEVTSNLDIAIIKKSRMKILQGSSNYYRGLRAAEPILAELLATVNRPDFDVPRVSQHWVRSLASGLSMGERGGRRCSNTSAQLMVAFTAPIACCCVL